MQKILICVNATECAKTVKNVARCKMTKIKKCGCGGKAKAYQDYMYFWLVQCSCCGVGTLHCYKTKEDAVKDWNNAMKTAEVQND